MTSRERLIGAMRLEQVDRVPIHVRGVNAWDEAWVESRHESYRPIIEAVREHGDYFVPWGVGGGPLYTASPELKHEARTVQGADWDERIVTMHTPEGSMQARYLTSNRGLPGMQMEHFVKNLGDVDRVLSVPYEPLRPDVSGFAERVAALGDGGVVTCDFCNPITSVHDLMGSELLGIWSRQERATIRLLVETIAERLRDLVGHLVKAGIGPVFRTLGQEFCIPPLMSPADFDEFCIRIEAPIHEDIHAAGGLVHVHSHGPMDDVLEGFAELGADCLHPIEPPPMGDVELADAKRRIGDRVCLEGNLQIGDIYAAPTHEVVAKTRAAIDAAGPKGFILCPTASPHTVVLTEQCVANYLAMIDTAADSGG